MHPAVAQVGGGGFVSRSSPRTCWDGGSTISPRPFASGLSMRHSIALSNGYADRVEVHVVRPVDGIGAERLGLAVELAQRHAHRLEEAEGVRTQRRAAGRGGAEVGKAQPVAQSPEQQQIGQPGPRPLVQRRQAQPHADSKSRRLSGEASMTRARTSAAICSQTRGANSTKVGPTRGSRPWWSPVSSTKLTRIRRDQRLAEHVDLLHDPGQRQHGDIVVVAALGIDAQGSSRSGGSARRPVSMASFGCAVVPEVVHRIATSSPLRRLHQLVLERRVFGVRRHRRAASAR